MITLEGRNFHRQCWQKVPPNVAQDLNLWLHRKKGPILFLTIEVYRLYYEWSVNDANETWAIIRRNYDAIREHQECCGTSVLD